MILFSIPVHEKQDIVHNHIENILYYNPNSKIILHINPTFHSFSEKYILSIYKNVYINPIRYHYIHGKGLLWIHIQNFKYALSQSISFDTFVLLSSNEMFIQSGLNTHIQKYKNGIQLVKYNKSDTWHNFHKNIQNVSPLKELLESFKQKYFYGGQAEGNFFQKDIFIKICEIYLTFFGTTELYSFETEEVVLQTIFEFIYRKNIKSISPPITFQNYSNDIPITMELIESIKNNDIIQNKTINGTLISPHIGISPISNYVYSIKRILREFYPLRYSLTHHSFIFNQSNIIPYQKYYCHENSFIVHDNNIIECSFKNDMKWLGWYIQKGIYQISGIILNTIYNVQYCYHSGFFLIHSKQFFPLSMMSSSIQSNTPISFDF